MNLGLDHRVLAVVRTAAGRRRADRHGRAPRVQTRVDVRGLRVGLLHAAGVVGERDRRVQLGTAITQISARTPASTAMTAITLDHLTGGRFILGLGVSGPQVVEGWYCQEYAKPLARTREYVDIVRAHRRPRQAGRVRGRALPDAPRRRHRASASR